MMDDKINQTEKHFAIVTRVIDDTLKEKLRGAVYFKSETLTGDTEYPIPAEPSFNQAGANGEGWFWTPQVGDQIEIEVDVNDEHTVPRYLRMIYSDIDEIPQEFKTNYSNRFGYRSRLGNLFLMDNLINGEKPREKAGEKRDLDVTKENDFYLLKHHIGTGFLYTKEGDEIRIIKRDLVELIGREVIREITGKVSEIFTAEVIREYGKKLTETIKDDVILKIQGNYKIQTNKDMEIKTTKTKVESSSTMDFKSGGDMKLDSGANCEIKATKIILNAEGSGVTTMNSHLGVIDLITGSPVTPSPTIMGDI